VAAARRILFISNGYGEDSVGAEIVKRLPPSCRAAAYPTLGPGKAYDGICEIVGPRAQLASEGSRVAKGTVTRDIATGGLGTLLPGIAFMKAAKDQYDHFVVIGDFIGVAGCFFAGIRGITYLDVYKTGYGRPYSGIEKWMIKQTCSRVFNRSQVLADTLTAIGVDAVAAGNVMMDTITSGDFAAGIRRSRLRAVTLLPGSRDQTAANFAVQIAALRLIPEDRRPDIFLALANGVDVDALAQAANLKRDGERLTGDLSVHVARGAVRNCIEASDLVLSQAGTATIQALGLGVPAITFTRSTDRMKRFLEENRLFGGARLLTSDDPAELARVTLKLLDDPAELAWLGVIGRQRIGEPGVIDKIIASVTVSAP
jgi:uncharacterized protein (TIGR03492 family)